MIKPKEASVHVPPVEKCLQIMDVHGMIPNIRRHSLMVARVAAVAAAKFTAFAESQDRAPIGDGQCGDPIGVIAVLPAHEQWLATRHRRRRRVDQMSLHLESFEGDPIPPRAKADPLGRSQLGQKPP